MVDLYVQLLSTFWEGNIFLEQIPICRQFTYMFLSCTHATVHGYVGVPKYTVRDKMVDLQLGFANRKLPKSTVERITLWYGTWHHMARF